MFLLRCPRFPLHLPVSQQARGGRHRWEIVVMKSEAVTFNEAVFVWNTHPGSRVEHLLADFVLASPSVTLPRKGYLLKWRAQNAAAAVETGSSALRPPRAHLGSCSMFTSVVVLGASFYSLKTWSGKWKPLWDFCVLWADLTKGT